MIVHTTKVQVQTKGFGDCIDITPHLVRCIQESKVVDGLLTVMNPGSTGAITTIEYEPGVINDLKRALERLAPMDMEY